MFDNTAFKTAQENMLYDAKYCHDLSQNQDALFFRFYPWQSIGLTQSEKRPIPKDLRSFEHAFRLTGGGIVFHCPGDIVFSHVAPIKHPLLPHKLKDRCYWMANTIKKGLHSVGIHVQLAGERRVNHTSDSIMFCNTYHNPYECLLNNDKICGLALKKTRSTILFQGSIHLQNTQKWFPELTDRYGSYFTKGCSKISPPPTKEIITAIQIEIKKALTQ
tara:strand:- start:2015 stop:2668 length:654 start_codon:yes stop_codon:yes gene_type:complete